MNTVSKICIEFTFDWDSQKIHQGEKRDLIISGCRKCSKGTEKSEQCLWGGGESVQDRQVLLLVGDLSMEERTLELRPG